MIGALGVTVLSQVAFRGVDSTDMKSGTVYINNPDLNVRKLTGFSAKQFILRPAGLVGPRSSCLPLLYLVAPRIAH